MLTTSSSTHPKEQGAHASDAPVTTITGTGQDTVDINWAASDQVTATKTANGSVNFTDVQTGRQVIVRNAADVVVGDRTYDVATGSWTALPASDQTAPTAALSAAPLSAATVGVASGAAPSTAPLTIDGVTTWAVEQTDAAVVSVTGTGKDIVDINWGDSSWFTVTKEANGSLDFTDIHGTGHQVIVSDVAGVIINGEEYDVATGTWSALAQGALAVSPLAPPVGAAPSTAPQTASDGVTTWTVESTDAAVVAITGTGQDIVDINWGDASWFTVTKEADGSLDFTDIHGTGHQVIVSDVAAVVFGGEEYDIATNNWAALPPTEPTGPSTPPEVKTWTVESSDAAIVTITGTGQDIVDIDWGDSTWFTVTPQANGSLDFTDVHGTGHQVIVNDVAEVVFGGEEYNVATGTWTALAPTEPTTPSLPSTGAAPSTAPQTASDGVTTWTVEQTDAAVVAITGTGQDIVDIDWGDSTWFTVAKEANGSLDITDIHGTGHQVVVSDVAEVVFGSEEYNVAAGSWSSLASSGQTSSSGSSSSGSSSSGSSSTPPAGVAPSTAPQTSGDGITTWTVESTDAAIVSITGTGQDIVNIDWGESTWFTVAKEADGSLDFTDDHGTGHQIIVSDVAEVIVGSQEYNVATGSWGTAPPTLPPSIDTPSVPQPSGASQVVGLTLQNPGTTAIAARYITFGEQFTEGQVPASGALIVIINGQQFAVQMDVKTRYADGSVQSAVLTMQQPALAAGESLNAMLALGTASTASAVDIGTLTDANYNVDVALTLHNADGSTTALSYDAAALLQAALKAGTVSYWLKGPEATEVTFNVAVQSSMYLTFDVTLYADGSTHTDVEFNNDIAMSASGGTMTYDVAITQNGAAVLQQNDVTQYQYQTWHEDVWSNGAQQVNIVNDVAALERTGLVQNYDLTLGVAANDVSYEVSTLGGPTYGILGSGGITQYMPETGLRPDIGPLPEWDVIALMTQNAGAQAYAQAQADASGSIPWHFVDGATGDVITMTDYPDLWTDSRAGPQYGGTPLTQEISGDTGWSYEFDHAPDVAYLQYLQTGDTYYLEQLNAEASAIPLAYNPAYRDGAEGVFATTDQVRGIAWNLRTLVEAATANPDGSADKAYFTQLVDNNLNALLAFTQTAQEGQLTGWFPGTNGDGTIMAPWQQNYVVTSLAFAAENGFSVATPLLQWETNFIAGEFLNGANGLSPWDGADYDFKVVDPSTGQLYQTWSDVYQASSQIAGDTNADPGSWPSIDYIAMARAALADLVTTTGSTEALQAFGWVSANDGGTGFQTYLENNPTYDIAPRLSDGNLLTQNNIFIYDDAKNLTITAPGGNSDQLVYETGSGNVTLQGGNGINILFGGSGVTMLNGGSNGDYLYAGTGTTTIYGGAGDNFMQSGCPTAYTAGATTFMLNPADIANDTISGFRIGTDHLQIAGDAPGSATLSALIAGATPTSSGGSMLQLNNAHDVTLLGITTSQLSQSMFA